MAASRSFGAFAGAQSQPPVTAPVAQVPSPGPQAQSSSFAEVLRGMIPPASQPMPQAMPAPRLPRIPQDSSARPEQPNRTALAMLAARMAKPQQQSPPPKSEPSPTGFVPGVRPEPTGPTGHEIANSHPEKLDAVIADLKAKGLKPTAANLVEGWNARHPDLPANDRRIRTAFAKHTRSQEAAARERYLMAGALGATKAG